MALIHVRITIEAPGVEPGAAIVFSIEPAQFMRDPTTVATRLATVLVTIAQELTAAAKFQDPAPGVD